MLPWNYGFHWNPGHIIFLGAFYCVLAAMVATLVAAARRTRRAVREHRVEEIGWHSDFHDLPARDRVCRHVLSGEFTHRECPNAFDCRKCETHAKLIGRFPLAAADHSEEDLFGMAFPLDRYYHRGHAWVHPEPDGTVTVGIDELGSRLIGTPDAVDLPKAGAKIQANGTAFRLHKRDADVRVLSPVDGEVVESGGADRGWYLRVRPAATGEKAFRHLLRGAEIRPWVLREMERLQLALAAEGAAPTLADGGVPVADIAASYPQANWDAVCGEIFLES
jgi:glycine cleavage system H lipoate-binding protein